MNILYKLIDCVKGMFCEHPVEVTYPDSQFLAQGIPVRKKCSKCNQEVIIDLVKYRTIGENSMLVYSVRKFK